MAHMINIPIEAPPGTVKVRIDFYDNDEKEALLASPIGMLLADFPKTIRVPTQDLCAYFLYYKKRPGVAGSSDHVDMVRKWAHALVEFDGQIVFEDSSIRSLQVTDQNTGTSEKVGESLGLCVSSHIHNLHQADWARIAKTNVRKTLDFWHPWTASDGKRFIQVETKGSAAKDNRLKSSSVSEHKASIKAKKAMATKEERKTSVLYGTIGVLDDKPGSVAQCWLVDPPTDVPDDPRRFKILTRLTYVAELISFLAARSTLASALQTRLAALSALKDIAPLDGVGLRKGNGEGFSEETFPTGGNHNPWFSGKSVVADGPAGGQVYVIDRSRLLLIAVQESLVVQTTRQDFDAISSYSFPASTVEKFVECVVPAGRFKTEFDRVMQISEDARTNTAGYVRFDLRGLLHYCQSGLVFGILPIPIPWQRK